VDKTGIILLGASSPVSIDGAEGTMERLKEGYRKR